MAADIVCRRVAGRAPRVLLAALLCAALPAALAAQTVGTPPAGVPFPDKPASVAKRPAPTHGWIEGAVRRPLTLDASVRADFSPRAAGTGSGTVLRAADGPLKDVAAALQSPVLRDETGRARALPGGVVVVLAEPLGDADARALIERHGGRPLRRIADRLWLLEAPAGLAALDEANRLAATGAFAGAQPNWWMQRTLK
jgi:hypothetical protein